MRARRLSIAVVVSLLGVGVSGLAWAQDEPAEGEGRTIDVDAEDDDDDTVEDEEVDADFGSTTSTPPQPPSTSSPTEPLAIPDPGPKSVPERSSERTGVRPAPGTQGAQSRPAPPSTPTRSAPADESTKPYFFVDAGYRMVWLGNVHAPTRGDDTDGLPRPQLINGQVAALLDQNVMLGLNYEMAANSRRGSSPFVLEGRIGWWDTAFGEPARRGPFNTVPGMSMTYIGWRWVHDHYRGSGGQWAGTADAAGLVLGYIRAANFGKLSVITDSQFSLYLLGWKNRSEFPLGLLNQRLSIGWDPIFIDARFKADPGTGSELSVGLSFQTLLAPRRKAPPKGD